MILWLIEKFLLMIIMFFGFLAATMILSLIVDLLR